MLNVISGKTLQLSLFVLQKLLSKVISSWSTKLLHEAYLGHIGEVNKLSW